MAVFWRWIHLGVMIAVFAYAWKWGFWWALLLALCWPIWLAYRGFAALLAWMAL